MQAFGIFMPQWRPIMRSNNFLLTLPHSIPLNFLGLALCMLLLVTQSAPAQTYTVIYRFKGASDGRSPYAGVIRDSDDNLYGTTTGNGLYPGYGTVFKISKCGKETVLHRFPGGLDGEHPYGGLVRDAKGNLYGTTSGNDCWEGNCGTVFKIDKRGKESVLYRFGNLPDGNTPDLENLLLDKAGNIYGTTELGGYDDCNNYGLGCGTVFKLDRFGKETVLHRFRGRDGAFPSAGLVPDAVGNLYSTTFAGGVPGYGCQGYYGCGTVFKVDKTGKLIVLHRFSKFADGMLPLAGVIRDEAGNIYGTVTGGGKNLSGAVFKLDKCGRETVLYSFTQDDGMPLAGLVRDAKGNLYGTTMWGSGSDYYGTVFKLDKAGKRTTLHSFGDGADGAFPQGKLVMDEGGRLYGTTIEGGDFTGPCQYEGCGVVFEVTP